MSRRGPVRCEPRPMRYARIHTEVGPRYARANDDGSFAILDDAPWLGGSPTGTWPKNEAVRFAVPTVPTKILGIGKSYLAHAEEMGAGIPDDPIMFLKAPNALLAHEETIRLPVESTQVEHEGELAVVIGRRIRRATLAQAREAIFGVTCMNDVTARDLQRKDVQFTRGKSFDTFGPIGPFVVTGVAYEDLALEVRVNGVVKQSGRTSQLRWSVDELVMRASQSMTLEPGDVLTTGTPHGVSRLSAG